jgi:hypothetical protein
MNKFDPPVYLYRLSSELDLDPIEVKKILELYTSIIKHENWSAQRSRRGLLVDCVYLYCNAYGKKLTIRTLKGYTKKQFGVATQPRPAKIGGIIHQLQPFSKSLRRTPIRSKRPTKK